MMILVLGLGLSAQMAKSSACESLFPYMCSSHFISSMAIKEMAYVNMLVCLLSRTTSTLITYLI